MSHDKFQEIKQQILTEIKKSDTIIIHRHERSDPDALGHRLDWRRLFKPVSLRKQFTQPVKITRHSHFWLKWNPQKIANMKTHWLS